MFVVEQARKFYEIKVRIVACYLRVHSYYLVILM